MWSSFSKTALVTKEHLEGRIDGRAESSRAEEEILDERGRAHSQITSNNVKHLEIGLAWRKRRMAASTHEPLGMLAFVLKLHWSQI